MGTLLALGSCQEFREGPELASLQEDVTYQVLPPVLDPSGRISFANLVSFSDFVEKNADKPGEELVFFEGQFVSLRQKNEELAERNPSLLRVLDEDVEEDPIIVDDFTASIVNEKREVMIDGKVVRYTEFGTWVYDDYFTDRVEQLLLSTTEEAIDAIYASHDFDEDPFYELEPGIFIFGLALHGDDYDYEEMSLNQTNARMVPWSPALFDYPGCNKASNRTQYIHPNNKWNGGVRIIQTHGVKDKRRMKVKVWSTNYITHATGGFETKYQRRTLGAWWRYKADQISVSVRANIYYPIPDGTPGLPDKLYMPIKIDQWLYGNGYLRFNDERNAKLGFGIITAQIGISNNLQSLLQGGITNWCEPANDFRERNGQNPIPTKPGQKPKRLCKPKWKPAKNVKIKNSESCHFVRDGSTTREIQISTKFDG
ncbi:hypothetical protein [Mongoliitalea lutea]|uniref:Uncharacterized protein n=1 Tax=Mongoliitalea lutea TaxID=849756 RepID=A0A8J3CYU5_9BACT|nr:hypothetical protein [Mongoliitalea lutea]GHB39304.1 hypothetical protein GCM10008106_20650 [Mongoliitalea lutea]